jgi:hypothetical protein
MSKLKLLKLLKNHILEQGPGRYNEPRDPDDPEYGKRHSYDLESGKFEEIGAETKLGTSSVYSTTCDAPLDSQITAILHQEEGFTSKPRWDVNNFRMGYGSMTTTYSDGTFEYLPNKRPEGHENEDKCTHPEGKNKKGVKWKDYEITKEDADRDFERIIKTIYLAEFKKRVGSVYDELPPCVIAPIISVMYNYGAYSDAYNSVINAAKNKDYCSVSNQISILSSNAGRRKKEAQWVKECACTNDKSVKIEPSKTVNGPIETITGSYTAEGRKNVYDALHSFNYRRSDKFGGYINSRVKEATQKYKKENNITAVDVLEIKIKIEPQELIVDWEVKIGPSTDGYSYEIIDSRGSAGGGPRAVEKQLSDMHGLYPNLTPVLVKNFNEDVPKYYVNDRKKSNQHGTINIQQKFFKYGKKINQS